MKKTVKANYNFKIDTVNDVHHITYSKDKFGAGLGCGIFFLITMFMMIVPLPFFTSSFKDNLIFRLVLMIGLTFLILRLINNSRKEKTFEIGNDFVGVDNNKYSTSDIQKIYIKDPKGNMYRTTNNGGTGFIIAGRGMGAVAVGAASVASSGARATSEIMKKSIHKASFSIEFLYGNRKIALAKGLSEENAYVLFDKVTELLNQKS